MVGERIALFKLLCCSVVFGGDLARRYQVSIKVDKGKKDEGGCESSAPHGLTASECQIHYRNRRPMLVGRENAERKMLR